MNLFILTFRKGNTDRKFSIMCDSAVPTVKSYIRSEHGDVGEFIRFEFIQMPMCYEGTDGKTYEVTVAEATSQNHSGVQFIAGSSSVTYTDHYPSAQLAQSEPGRPKSFWKRLFE